jgi:hypothetical protein
MVQAAEEQLQKIASAMIQLVGPERAHNRMEELRAGVEASITAAATTAASSASAAGGADPHTARVRATSLSPATIDLLSSYASTLGERGRVASLMSSPTTSSLEENRVQIFNYLDRLVALLGGGHENPAERLTYEIMLDRFYRVSPPPAESFTAQTSFPLTESLPTTGAPAGCAPVFCIAISRPHRLHSLKQRMCLTHWGWRVICGRRCFD